MINNYLKSRISCLHRNTLDKGNLISQHEQIEEMTRVTKIRAVLEVETNFNPFCVPCNYCKKKSKTF